MSRKMLVLMCSIFLIVPLLFMGCSGDDGATGATGPAGQNGQDLTAAAKPETCVICHAGAGDKHQEFYDDLYQDNVIAVTGLGVSYTAPNVYRTTFTMTKKDSAGFPQPFNCQNVANLNIYIVASTDNNTFEMPDATIPPDGEADRLSLKPAPDNVSPYTYRGSTTTVGNGTTGLCTVTGTFTDNVADFTGTNGVLVVYGYDEQIGLLPPSRVRQVAYPYANILKIGTVPYVSAANVAGCEKCHIIPFLKHGNIYGQVNKDKTTDFITCKACHLDNGPGGHQFWQELVDDPEMAAREHNGTLTAADNTARAAKYAYKTSLMNDVHMSHAMEFEYPQSMATCATCHAGKLDKILTDNNFVVETCRSCHPVTGSAQAEKPQGALKTIAPAVFHSGFKFDGTDAVCNSCHNATGVGKDFKEIHTGYNKIIYATDNGLKYSSAIVVTIDNASFDNNILTFGFHATGNAGGLAATGIKPTVLVGLYGYNTKDFIVDPHSRTGGERTLEYVVGATHPRFTTDNTTAAGTWKVTANLSTWAGMIANGSVKRVEIGVIPTLRNPALPAGDNIVALNAPSKTFDLKTKKFVNFYPEIVNVIPPAKGPSGGCNNCHDALAVGFHAPDRGGNIVVCRLCHNTRTGSSHLEMQSRSIDSYAHAIHTFQDFDIGDIDFDNVVASMFHDLKTESQYPTFDRRNCVSCHNAGRFNPPAQDKSLPGILSASDNVAGRAINQASTTENDVPAYVTGPGSRACGACHRAVMIKEDQAAELASFNQHTKDGGYLLVPGDTATLEKAINAILPTFNDGVFVDITP